ncbi:AraC family transcriptional regulator ligand-binding domain-containing protein [Novosphingobium piscinae]|uniref:AraC family transcriptional regulator ligand-binding domain-containing protein n=1 Tax=Novosphingobium piscinae TaxID=1507448 RepID=A0A7X1FYZ6_9SPHN|nr:AraC family transcriptional regulator [Novosphingobium piscinae]MBC2669561.1 AraC family transcriptional regulator ligand-binding domain-containing protein [Novosphingobium piscinae]
MTEATVRAAALNGWDNFCTLAPGLETIGSLPCERAPGAISLAEFVHFSESVVNRTRDVAIPWLVGVHYDLASLGQVGDAINAAGKVGTALRRLVEYFSLLQDCTDIRLDREDDMASVSYRILDPEIWPRHHDAMFSLGIVGQIIRRGTRGVWEKVEFSFEAKQYEMRGDIGKVVCAPCSFGADINQIRFPAAMLDLALPETDCKATAAAADVRALSRTLVDQRRRTPLVERLAQVVYRDLNSHGIEQERIAREIGMSSRTMRRKLAEEGSSFQQVLDECRMRQALFEFRTRPDLSIAQIALRLGYAEHSNFTRAFHRWTGMSPQAWRADLARNAQ